MEGELQTALCELRMKEIVLAVCVAKGTGQAVHNDRKSSGFVLNGENTHNKYIFSDGRVLDAKPNDLFFLPEGSSYSVKAVSPGECYCINFETVGETDIPPFSIKFRETDTLFRLFSESVSLWRAKSGAYVPILFRNVYDIIRRTCAELSREYLPGKTERLIGKAEEILQNGYCDPSLTVASLSRSCSLSEAYFRRIFSAKYGVSPKEYITKRRMEFAARLLLDDTFSVCEVAAMSGYPEACRFSREFKKAFGTSPRAFRETEKHKMSENN